MPPLNQIIHDVDRSTFKLDTCGIAGLLGGNNAVDALETIHLYEGRRWAGWYNYPGTVDVAKTFGQMANSRWWDSVFPGSNESPAVTFRLAGKFGPEYKGSFSGTKLRTGYPGYLMAQKSQCPSFVPHPLSLTKKDYTEGRKTGSSATVVVISLPERKTTEDPTQKHTTIPINPKCKFRHPIALCSIVPSAVSILACVFCIIAHDRLCASLIFVGIICSGLSSLVLGTAALRMRVPVPSPSSPPGDGLMFPEDGTIIILKGKEADVNVVTKGQFELDYSAGILPHPNHHTIGFTSVLLYLQFLVQLLLTPRCTLFGQILFLASFVASGGYHLYVASHEREMAHWELLSGELNPTMEKWTLGTRTQMAVFVCLVLGEGNESPLKADTDAVLNSVLPNDTPVWRYWRKKVIKETERFWSDAPSCPYDPSIQCEPSGTDGKEDETEANEYSRLTKEDRKLLRDLIDDAWCIFKKYPRWRDGESKLWQSGSDCDSNASLLSDGSTCV